VKELGRAAKSRFVPHCAKWTLGLCLALFGAACLNPLPDDLPAEKDAPPSAAGPGGDGASQGSADGLTDTQPPAATTPDIPTPTVSTPGSSGEAAPEAPDAGAPAPAADAGSDAAPPELEP
jgi:hypothetical protein